MRRCEFCRWFTLHSANSISGHCIEDFITNWDKGGQIDYDVSTISTCSKFEKRLKKGYVRVVL